jgi:hypothetical protein
LDCYAPNDVQLLVIEGCVELKRGTDAAQDFEYGDFLAGDGTLRCNSQGRTKQMALKAVESLVLGLKVISLESIKPTDTPYNYIVSPPVASGLL